MSNPKKHVCTYVGCTQAFNRPFKLSQHLLSHNNRAYACKEAGCSKSYTSKSHLDRHIRCVHKVPKCDVIYSCPTCLKTYSNRQNLKRHIKLFHKLATSFLCDHCNLKFKKKNQLSAHMYQHTGIKSFSCDMCPKEFITLYEKKRHLRYHRIYTCDICKSVFNHWSKFQKHLKTSHTKNEFICNDCGRKFSQRSHIVRHVKTHYGVVVKKYIECPYEGCSRRYSRRTFLRHHIVTKHEKCKLRCSICDTELVTKAKLNYHMKLHNKPENVVHKKKSKSKRKERKDKGSMKTSTAMKLAGLSLLCDNESTTNMQNTANLIENKKKYDWKIIVVKEDDEALKINNIFNENTANLLTENENKNDLKITISKEDNESQGSDNIPNEFPFQNSVHILIEAVDNTFKENGL